MTYVKLDDAIKAVKAIEVPLGGFYDKIDLYRLGREPTAKDLARIERYKDAKQVLWHSFQG